MTAFVPKQPEAAMRHDPASGAIIIMLRSLKMYGLAQAVTDLMDRAMVRHSMPGRCLTVNACIHLTANGVLAITERGLKNNGEKGACL